MCPSQTRRPQGTQLPLRQTARCKAVRKVDVNLAPQSASALFIAVLLLMALVWVLSRWWAVRRDWQRVMSQMAELRLARDQALAAHAEVLSDLQRKQQQLASLQTQHSAVKQQADRKIDELYAELAEYRAQCARYRNAVAGYQSRVADLLHQVEQTVRVAELP